MIKKKACVRERVTGPVAPVALAAHATGSRLTTKKKKEHKVWGPPLYDTMAAFVGSFVIVNIKKTAPLASMSWSCSLALL